MGENGARAQWAGAGLTMPKRYLTPATLRWMVEEVLQEPRYRARAQELSAWAKQNHGPSNAASLVEDFAK
jgi:UDP:flavonoid glycosyltransferase YjiC (YdhE family)